MERSLTCIVCPVGCSLLVKNAAGEDLSALTITGNRCSRGIDYAQEEIRSPKRVVTATCGIAFPQGGSGSHRSLTAPRRIPVKTTAPCPKEKIHELLGDIYRVKVSLPVKAGDCLIADWKGSGIDVVSVRTLE